MRMPWAARGEPVELVSPLTADECVRRLRETMDSPWTVFGRRKVLGRVTREGLSARKRLRFGNSLQTYVRGAIEAGPDQTRIRCRFGIHPLAQAFLAVWFGFVSLLFCAMGAFAVFVMRSEATQTTSLGDGATPVNPWAFVLPPAAMIVLAYVLVRFGLWLARDERRFLTVFLCTTLEAREATARAAAPP